MSGFQNIMYPRLGQFPLMVQTERSKSKAIFTVQAWESPQNKPKEHHDKRASRPESLPEISQPCNPRFEMTLERGPQSSISKLPVFFHPGGFHRMVLLNLTTSPGIIPSLIALLSRIPSYKGANSRHGLATYQDNNSAQSYEVTIRGYGFTSVDQKNMCQKWLQLRNRKPSQPS